MRRNLLVILFASALVATVPVASAAEIVIGFDDLATPNTGSGIANWGLVPSDYAGFAWTGWEVTSQPSFSAVYGALTFPSDPNAVYNGGDGNAVIVMSSASTFDFLGADLSAWPGVDGYAATSVTVAGYRGGVEVGSPTVVTLSSGFNPVSIPLEGVDTVTFTAPAGRYYLVDDVSVVTPEPATFGFIGSACFIGIGLALARRRRASK